MTLSDEQIDELAALDRDELLRQIGVALAAARQDGGLGARPPSLRNAVDEANKWLAGRADQIAVTICGNAQIRQLAEGEMSMRGKLVRLVADVLSASFVVVPCGTLAEIVVRDGLASLCKERWTPTPKN